MNKFILYLLICFIPSVSMASIGTTKLPLSDFVFESINLTNTTWDDSQLTNVLFDFDPYHLTPTQDYCAISPVGSFTSTASNRAVYLSTPRDWKPANEYINDADIAGGHSGAWDYTGTYCASVGNASNKIKIWSYASGALTTICTGTTTNIKVFNVGPVDLVFCPGRSDRIAVVDNVADSISVWNFNGSTCTAMSYVQDTTNLDSVRSVYWTKDGTKLITTAYTSSTIAVWSVNASTGIITAAPYMLKKDATNIGGMYEASVNPSGDRLVVFGRDDDGLAIYKLLWATPTINYETKLTGLASSKLDMLLCGRWNWNGTHIFATGFNNDSVAAYRYDYNTGALTYKQIYTSAGYLDQAHVIDVMPNGNEMSTSGQGAVNSFVTLFYDYVSNELNLTYVKTALTNMPTPRGQKYNPAGNVVLQVSYAAGGAADAKLWYLSPTSNSSPALRFDGVNNSYDLTGGVASNIAELWIVYSKFTNANSRLLGIRKGTGYYRPYLDGDDFWFYEKWSGSDAQWTKANISTYLDQHLMELTYDDTNSANDPVYFLDGADKSIARSTAPVGAANVYTGQTMRLGTTEAGGAAYWDGYIQRVIGFSVPLTAAQRTSFRSFLDARYNLSF